MDDIEHQLRDVLNILATNLSSYEKGRQPRPPEVEEEDEEEEDGEEESGSGTPSSSEEEEDEEEEEGVSPDEEENNGKDPHHSRRLTPPIVVIRPVMARNAGMGRSGGSGVHTAGLNNVRKQMRYPRLLRKKVVNLDTIEEIQDELIHEAVSGGGGLSSVMGVGCNIV